MSEKKLNTLVLAGLLGIDAVYLYTAFTARKYKMVFVGPYEFPKLIGIMFAVLCLISLVSTLAKKGEDKKFRIENALLVVITVVATAAFLLLWEKIGSFYLVGSIYLLVLFFAYRDAGGRLSKKNIITNLVLTACVMAFIFLVFTLLMGYRM